LNYSLRPCARERLVSNIAGQLSDGVSEKVLARAFEYWKNVDQDLGERIAQALTAIARRIAWTIAHGCPLNAPR
jgi:catalase